MLRTSNEIMKIFNDNEIHYVNEIIEKVKMTNPEIQENSARRAVQRLRNQNKIYKVSKDAYCVGYKNTFKPSIQKNVSSIYRYIEKMYPEVEYLVWDTKWLNNMSHNYYSFSVIIVEVEKDLEETIYEYLTKKYKKIYINPTEKEYKTYIIGEEAIVVKTMLKRSPRKKVEKIEIPKLEKIIVDTFVEHYAFEWMQGSEWNRFVNNIVDTYEIDFTTIINYAKYRNKEDEIINKLYNIIDINTCYWRILDVYKRKLSKGMAAGKG